jgi:chemotaxis-related protein WspD
MDNIYDNLAASNEANKCWELKGSFGANTCKQLEDYVICHNCPDYISSGRKLFEREIPEELLDEWTVTLAKEKELEKQGNTAVVVFRIGEEWLALKTIFFQGIVENRLIHTIPHRTNKFFRGIVNVNGELLLCVSVRFLLGLPDIDDEKDYSKAVKRMMVVVNNGERFVFRVDEALGVTRFSIEELEKAPATMSKYPKTTLSGIFRLNDLSVGLLDENKFFDLLSKGLLR